MKTTILISFILLAGILLPGTLSARIGETSAQCAARYGPALESSTATDGTLESTIHHKSGFSVTILYHGDICTTLIIQPRATDSRTRPAFSDVQLRSILAANAPRGHTWTRTEKSTHPTKTDIHDDPVTLQRWRTDDGKLLASHDTGTHLLILITAEQKRLNESARTRAQKQAVEDF